MSLLPSLPPEVRVERDGATIYADADGVHPAAQLMNDGA